MKNSLYGNSRKCILLGVRDGGLEDWPRSRGRPRDHILMASVSVLVSATHVSTQTQTQNLFISLHTDFGSTDSNNLDISISFVIYTCIYLCKVEALPRQSTVAAEVPPSLKFHWPLFVPAYKIMRFAIRSDELLWKSQFKMDFIKTWHTSCDACTPNSFLLTTLLLKPLTISFTRVTSISTKKNGKNWS